MPHAPQYSAVLRRQALPQYSVICIFVSKYPARALKTAAMPKQQKPLSIPIFVQHYGFRNDIVASQIHRREFTARGRAAICIFKYRNIHSPPFAVSQGTFQTRATTAHAWAGDHACRNIEPEI
eukprot:3656678-Pleurochrysis_carterae.AAC.3